VVASPKIAASLAGPTRSIGSQYQVVELFPGTPGVPQTWIGTLDGISTMENLEIAGQIPPTLAVIPAINVQPGTDTECMNFVGGAQVESWVTGDMKRFMQSFMGVDDRPWSAFGYSTGGWCAAEVAVLHQEQYSEGVSLAGYFSPMLPFGLSKREKNYLSNHYDLIKYLRHDHRNTKLMIIASVKDRFTNYSAQKFMKSANSLIPIKYIPIPSGGHNINVWKPYIAPGFLWISGANITAAPVINPQPSASGTRR
jgi:pimeloyl-ACP methyl ester carboxylesterase